MPWVVAAQADHPAVRQPSNDRTCQAQQQSQQYLAMTADRKRNRERDGIEGCSVHMAFWVRQSEPPVSDGSRARRWEHPRADLGKGSGEAGGPSPLHRRPRAKRTMWKAENSTGCPCRALP